MSGFDFIQIGANEGNLIMDPVWPFVYFTEWKGVFVEPFPPAFEKLVDNYSVVDYHAFENVAIMNYNGEVELFYRADGVDTGGLTATTNSEHYKERKRRTVKVPCITLSSLVTKYGLVDKDFKVLIIDAQGADGDIILNTDFDFVRPRFIQFEHCHLDNTDNVLAHLYSFGYELFLRDDENVILKRN